MKTNEIPRHHFKFRPEFVAAVAAGKKPCTIRKTRKRLPKAGEIAVLEYWTGKPYASKVDLISVAELRSVDPITITASTSAEPFTVKIGGKPLRPHEIEKLAKSDGFESVEKFREFFGESSPFEGHLYEWVV